MSINNEILKDIIEQEILNNDDNKIINLLSSILDKYSDQYNLYEKYSLALKSNNIDSNTLKKYKNEIKENFVYGSTKFLLLLDYNNKIDDTLLSELNFDEIRKETTRDGNIVYLNNFYCYINNKRGLLTTGFKTIEKLKECTNMIRFDKQTIKLMQASYNEYMKG